ncbi:phospholipase A(1) LCAT3-like [Aristolochia californica]|uniref:phospholipase A(1) LCAT3-like n=1 Tax=Aristolochia californica TaxID=171875 RepID=UPI0035D563CA
MLGDCDFLPCFRRKKSRAGHELNPVLLIPGIAGSVLNARNKTTGLEIRAWVRIFLADLEFKRKLWATFNPKTGYTESFDPNVDILVPDDDYGLYAIDILDPSWFVKLVHLTDVYYFHDMINMLIECGYEKGTTLFGYGYDFRQSNRIDKAMDGLKLKLAAASKASGGKKIDIISHSMGGLLMLSFLSLHPDVFAKYVNKWICIACPFQGAAACINDRLLRGVELVSGLKSLFFVKRWTLHQLIVECPSIYEMLPNPDFAWRQPPVIRVWRKQSETADHSELPVVELESYGPDESSLLFEEALKDNELTYGCKTIPLPFNNKILSWAAQTRQVFNNARLPSSVSFYNIFGSSFDTPFDVCYGTESSPINDLSEIWHSTPQFSFADGDGIVPAESAKADGLLAAARVAVKVNHQEMLTDETVFELIRQWLGVSKELRNSSKVIDEAQILKTC